MHFNKGFAPVFILVGILILAAIGGGVYVYNQGECIRHSCDHIPSPSLNKSHTSSTNSSLTVPGISKNIGQSFSSDGQHVYYINKVVLGADPNSFLAIPSDYDEGYGKDKLHVYYENKVIVGADPATFALIQKGREFSKDAHYVYDRYLIYTGAKSPIVPGADPATFTALDGGFEKDSSHVFYGIDILQNADPKTFSIITDNVGAKNETVFAKDTTHVFYDGGWGQAFPSIIQGADPTTFKVLDDASYSGGYAKDNHAVYWGDAPVGGADASSFVSMAPYGKDNRAVYLYTKTIVGADPNTFTVLQIVVSFDGSGYSKDAHAVYFNDHKLIGADPTTFHAAQSTDSTGVDAKDKNHTYSMGGIVN